MTFSCPSADFAEVLGLARRFGYDGVEPRAGSGHAHGFELEAAASDRAALRDQAAEAGVALPCLATGCRFADPESVDENIEQARGHIDLAGDCGIPRLRVFGGKVGEGLSRADAIALVAGSLRKLADQAAGRGVTLCMETHDDWCDPDHVSAVMRAADHPAVAVNWDIMHPVRVAGRSMQQAHAALRPWIRHVHVHDGVLSDGPLRFAPIGKGDIDHRSAIALLLQDDYDGYLSGEWIDWESADEHLGRELQAMRTIEKDVAGGND